MPSELVDLMLLKELSAWLISSRVKNARERKIKWGPDEVKEDNGTQNGGMWIVEKKLENRLATPTGLKVIESS